MDFRGEKTPRIVVISFRFAVGCAILIPPPARRRRLPPAVSPIHLTALNTLLVQGAHIGSRVVASLLALKLGANPFTIGLLIGVYSVFPLMLGVYSGRISDRYGPRRPMVFGIALLALGLALPVIWTALPMLFVSAVLVGTGFVFYNVANQTLGGALGPP